MLIGKVADQDILFPDLVLEDPVVDDDADVEEIGPQKLGEDVRALDVAVPRANLPGKVPIGCVTRSFGRIGPPP